MQEQDPLNPADMELERALRSVSPAGARMDVASAAFDAGRRSQRHAVRRWRAGAGLALVVGAASWLFHTRPNAVVPSSGASDPVLVARHQQLRARSLSDESVLMLWQAVRSEGVDGLPAPQFPSAPGIRASDSL